MYAAQSHIYDPPAVSINMASDQHVHFHTIANYGAPHRPPHLAARVRINLRVWLIAKAGSVWIKLIRPSCSSGFTTCFRLCSKSDKLVHSCPEAGTACLGSSQITPCMSHYHPLQHVKEEKRGHVQRSRADGYCVPQARHTGSRASSWSVLREWEGMEGDIVIIVFRQVVGWKMGW